MQASSHWNAAGWFGAQLGGTAWLFASALALPESESAAILLGCALAANGVGCALFALRARLDPYRALQMLVLVIVAAGAAALALIALFELKRRDARGPRAE